MAVDYKRYLASREWRLKRQEVIEMSDGWCYRCQSARISDVHHLTYEHIGDEPVEDLQGVCRPCHEYLSAERADDPAVQVILELLKQGVTPGYIEHFGLNTWWDTKDLTNGRSWSLDWKVTPEVENTQRPFTLVIPITAGLWMHCWWGS